MNLLYVTTFNNQFYNLCAKELLQTFLEHAEGTMLVCYEDDIPSMPVAENIIYNKIDDDPFMLKWLKDNEDVIPTQYGGKATMEFVAETMGMWNFRASRWFRKVVALNKSLDIYDDYDAIMFIDADSKFKKPLPSAYVESVFKDADVIYHLGMFRKKQPVHLASGIESGLVGYRREGGKELLKRYIESFRSGEFRKYPRWDDSYLLRMAVEQSPDLKCRDVVHNIAMPSSRVVDLGPFRDFIYHDKGKTTREIFNKGQSI